MKRFLFLIILSFLFTSSGMAQTCAFDEKLIELKNTNPEYAREFAATENYLRNYIATNRSSLRKSADVYTIPVVVHVMHTGGAIGSTYNPTDAQIMGAIDYVNEIYSGTLIGMQEPVEGGGVVNMGLRFALAQRTPGCGATNGIDRVDMSGSAKYVANGVNNANSNGMADLELKSQARWNTSQYYNIWVVNKIDGLDGTRGQFVAGYAYFAGAPAIVDGTVMLATQMRRGQKTLPHELGHAFNLHHPFNGSTVNTVCPTNTNCNSDGDGVCDTDPVAMNRNAAGVVDFSCRTGENSCAGRPYTRNTESNFMSYTNCYTLFTNGQRDRVQAAMTLPSRVSLINSPATTPCGPVVNFEKATDTKSEDRTGTTIGCRTFKDYEYNLAIGQAPDAQATATLTYTGTAVKGVDYDVTTNGDFDNPSNVLTFATGSNQSQPFTVRIYDNAKVEGARTVNFNFTISTTGNATKGTSVPTLALTISDNDVLPGGLNEGIYQLGRFSNTLSQPFNADNKKQKGQFMYTAAELLAAGIKPGPIVSLQLNISEKNTTGTFNNFTLKIGTNTGDFLYSGIANLGSGFTTVYSKSEFTTALGWNDFKFTTPFIWDGKSNIVVEYCYNSTTGTGLDRLAGYNTGEPSTYYLFVLKTGGDCATEFDSFTAFGSGFRPNIKLGNTLPGTVVETEAGQAKSENIGTGSDYYFYSNKNKIIAKVGNLDTQLGCVEAKVSTAGTKWENFMAVKRSAKSFDITPAISNGNAGYNVSLYFTEAELGGKDPNQLKIAKTTASDFESANETNTVTVNPIITRFDSNYVFTATFNGFSKFFLVDNLNILPVNIVSFTGKLNSQTETILDWKVNGQQNVKGYDVERSTDGQSFASIGFVNAKSGSGHQFDYTFTDIAPLYGLNYYRLKVMDMDGKFRYSQIVNVNNNATGLTVKMLGNPVNQNIAIVLQGNTSSNTNAALYNAVGAKVAGWLLGNRTGAVQLPINEFHLAPGIYLLKVTDGIKTETLKVIKK